MEPQFGPVLALGKGESMMLRVNRLTTGQKLRRLGACGVLALAWLVGCAGHTTPPSNDDDAAARRAEAMRLLGEAQKAQNAG